MNKLNMYIFSCFKNHLPVHIRNNAENEKL